MRDTIDALTLDALDIFRRAAWRLQRAAMDMSNRCAMYHATISIRTHARHAEQCEAAGEFQAAAQCWEASVKCREFARMFRAQIEER